MMAVLQTRRMTSMVDASRYIGGGNMMSAKSVKEGMLEGKPLTVSDVTETDFENDERKKLVLHFEETELTLALNSTNTKLMIDACGKLTEGWTGKTVRLMLTKVTFNKQLVDSIQIKAAGEGQ